MTKKELWTIYTNKNPLFSTGPITFTAAGLKKLFNQTWEQASKQSTEPTKINDNVNKGNSNIFDTNKDFGEIFNDLLGGNGQWKIPK